jgi:hypothetical protein
MMMPNKTDMLSNAYLSTISLLFAFIFLFTACTSENQMQPTDSAVILSETETQEPTAEPQLKITPTKINPIDYGIYDRFGDLITDPNQFPKMNGKLYLAIYDQYKYRTLIMIDLSTNIIQTILDENFGGGSVSPDGKLFSYIYERNNVNDKLITMDLNGSIIDEYVIDDRFYGFQWLNNESILFDFYSDEMPMFLYSPISEEQRTIQSYKGDGSAFLFIKDTMRDWGLNMYHRNVHNTQLTRLLYPTLIDNINMVVIRDVETATDLAQIPTNFGYGVWPSWSPDGEMLAIAINTNELKRENGYNKFEIFLYDQNGDQINQTNLLSLSRSVEIHKLLWSPNNQLIAFTYYSNSYGKYFDTKYGIWDIKNGTINNYCLPENAYFRNWSLDNNYLLLGVRDDSSDETAVYILDISSGDYLLIKEDFLPIGWQN